MPTPFSEIVGSTPRYSIVEDVRGSDQHMDYTNYDNVQGYYNSNDIIGGMPSPRNNKSVANPPSNYVQNNQMNRAGDLEIEPHAFRGLDINKLQQEKRDRSAADALADNVYPRIPAQVSPFLAGPGFAGGQPMLKDATNQQPQQMLPLRSREGFKMKQHLNCMDVMNHIRSCPLCSRYHSTDAKVYHILIFMLIVLFVVVLYFISKEERR
jgi:hypothetical protein